MDSGVRKRVLWTLAVVSLTVAFGTAVALSHSLETDFWVYRLGGSHFTSPSLYSTRVHSTTGPLLFTYPPFAAFLFWPLSRLSIGVGEMLWNTLSVVCLWTTIAISIRASVGRRLTAYERWLAAGLTAPAILLWPVRVNLALGQIELILLALILVDLFVPIRVGRRTLPQGVLIGLAAAIKLTPLIFVAYLAITGRRAAARTACLSFLSLTALTVAIAPRVSITYWTKDVFATQRIAQPLTAGNEALHGLLPRLGLFLSTVPMDLLSVTVLILGLVVARRANLRYGALPGVLVCAAVGLIVSPISWAQHYVWIIPAICWILVSNLQTMRKLLLVLVLTVIFGSHPIWLRAGPQIRGDWWFFLQADTYVLTALCFVGVMAVLARRTRHASSAAKSPSDPSAPLVLAQT